MNFTIAFASQIGDNRGASISTLAVAAGGVPDREALELPDEVWNVGLKKGEKGESAPQQPHDPFDESWDKTPMETVTVR